MMSTKLLLILSFLLMHFQLGESDECPPRTFAINECCNGEELFACTAFTCDPCFRNSEGEYEYGEHMNEYRYTFQDCMIGCLDIRYSCGASPFNDRGRPANQRETDAYDACLRLTLG